ncbi:Holliday junction resolvase MOC1, chloroplastic [Cyclospora cayetanensis]|uniref:Holliday junction resolvase MOC1, chloroplastic n=1 Tax=Cyclospora cayetanensis TaxID=88456 RepID=A0A6P6RXW2_9EIME|nr:Holliday junction resolvase MOC1, chloroplastic [Cyclospora cayetanensis]
MYNNYQITAVRGARLSSLPGSSGATAQQPIPRTLVTKSQQICTFFAHQKAAKQVAVAAAADKVSVAPATPRKTEKSEAAVARVDASTAVVVASAAIEAAAAASIARVPLDFPTSPASIRTWRDLFSAASEPDDEGQFVSSHHAAAAIATPAPGTAASTATQPVIRVLSSTAAALREIAAAGSRAAPYSAARIRAPGTQISTATAKQPSATTRAGPAAGAALLATASSQPQHRLQQQYVQLIQQERLPRQQEQEREAEELGLYGELEQYLEHTFDAEHFPDTLPPVFKLCKSVVGMLDECSAREAEMILDMTS